MGPSLLRPKLKRAPDDATLVAIILDGIPGTAMGSASLSDLEIAQVGAYVRSLGRRIAEVAPGDAAAGRRLYERNACATCHTLRGEGRAAGPDLTDVGARRGLAHLRQSLLEPGAALPALGLPYEPGSYSSFLPVAVTTRDGHDVEGYRINEDSFTLQLRDAAGELHSFRKADLVRLDRRAGTSLMPSYRETLSATELDDLVSYLASLGGQP